MEGMKNYADLLSQMLGDGVITPKLYAKSMQQFVTKNIIDFGLTDEEIDKIDESVALENEDIDLDEV